MNKKIGIVIDNYKTKKYETELHNNGFNKIKVKPLMKDTTIIQIIVEKKDLPTIQKICEKLEKYFKIQQN